MKDTFTAVFTALIGLAIVAVIFSPRSQTNMVVKSAGDAFSGILGVAVSPITGSGGGNGGAFAGAPGGPSINSVVGGINSAAALSGTIGQVVGQLT